MLPYLEGDGVVVFDRRTASTLINKGDFGRPLPGGGLELSLLEAVYLSGAERLEVKRGEKGKKMSHDELLLLGITSREGFLEDYLVFRDIRNRGMNIQQGNGGTFIAYPRGKGPKTGRSDSWLAVFRDSDKVTACGLYREAVRLEGMRMAFMAAVVDGDRDITYYRISPVLRDRPGSVLSGEQDGIKGVISIPGGGGILREEESVKRASARGLGSETDGTLVLSSEEVSYLERGSPGHSMKEEVYVDLKKRDFLVRTGFKYGSHFRVYTSGSLEEHSDLLVHCVGEEDQHTWEQLARAIRLSHSVRKRMLHAIYRPGRPARYLEIEWTRP